MHLKLIEACNGYSWYFSKCANFIFLGVTGIDRKEYRSVSMSEQDCSLRYQMMIEQ